MKTPQAGILQPLPSLARYLAFRLHDPVRLNENLQALQRLVDGETAVVGFGPPVVKACNGSIPGLKSHPAMTAPGLTLETPEQAIWIWLRGSDRGEILHRSRRITRALAPSCTLNSLWDAFKYDSGRDLSGYEDGTENPLGDDALTAALVGDEQPALSGSSFVAVQRWAHNFERFDAMSEDAANDAVGRRRSDNEELDDAPESSHVKRTAQESFTPEAFLVRRSMPWALENDGGLMFVAFGCSFDAFEAQLKRMVGGEDGIVDALFGFTQPVTGAYFWCPGMTDGKLDLSPLGL